MAKVGFIGLGNVGGKLAGSLLRNGVDLTVRDLDKNVAQSFLDSGAKWGESPKQMAETVDILITCLPSPAASAAVMEAEDGALEGLSAGKIWAEMSTTDEAEVHRLGALVKALGAEPVDCPVSGGCQLLSLEQIFSQLWTSRISLTQRRISIIALSLSPKILFRYHTGSPTPEILKFPVFGHLYWPGVYGRQLLIAAIVFFC